MVTFSRYVSHLYRYTIKDYQTIDYAYCIGKYSELKQKGFRLEFKEENMYFNKILGGIVGDIIGSTLKTQNHTTALIMIRLCV